MAEIVYGVQAQGSVRLTESARSRRFWRSAAAYFAAVYLGLHTPIQPGLFDP